MARTGLATRLPRAVRAWPVAMALLLVAAGGLAWWATAAGPPDAYLAAPDAPGRLEEFPSGGLVLVRVVVHDPGGDSVLGAEPLAALAGLRARITSDPAVVDHLAPVMPVRSVLAVLDLPGSAGEWRDEDVVRALAAARASPDRGRELDELVVRTDTTVMLVRLDPNTGDTSAAERRIGELATRVSGSTLRVAASSPALRDDAARSLGALWAPLGAVVLVGVGVLVTTRRPVAAGRTSLAAAAGVGLGLLAAGASGSTSPHTPLLAAVGALVGTVAARVRPLADEDRAARWWPVLVLAPLGGVLAAPAPGAVGNTIALAASAGGALWLGSALLGPPGETPWATPWKGDERSGLRRGAAVALVLLLAVPAALAGVATTSPLGTGTLPSTTQAGAAEARLDAAYGALAPGARVELTLEGELSTRAGWSTIAGLTSAVAVAAGPAADVASLTALADDWAVQDPSSPGDRFDANFSAIWSPIRSGEARVDAEVREAWTALAALDPTGFADVAQLDATGNVSTARLWAPASRTVPLPDVAAWRDTADRAGFALAVSGEAVDQSRLADTAPERVWAVAWTAAVAATLTAIAWGLAAAGDGTLGLGAGVSASVAALGTAGLLSALAGAEPVGLVLAPAVAAALAQAWATGPLPALARDLEQGAETEAAIAEARAAWATRAPLAAILLVTLALVWWTVPSVALASASASLLLAALVGSACGLVLQPAWAGLWAVPLARTRSMSAAPSAHLDCPVCRRRTATGASRCARCGRWHLVEACPAHPDVFPGRCVDCGSELAAPHFR